MGKRMKRYLLRMLHFTVVLFTLLPLQVHGQFSALINTFSSAQALIPGVKNIMGGILAADKIHNNCIQKTLCREFSPEIIETRTEFDPVKRSLVLVPKVIQPRGKLRWIGDAIVNMFTGISRRLGVDRMLRRSNRRQGGIGGIAANPLLLRGIEMAVSTMQKIPIERMINVFDLMADATPVMERNGAVYPYVRASALGYGFGGSRSDNLKDGVCSQVASDCSGSYWDHLEKANNYDSPLGKLSQRNSMPTGDTIRERISNGEEIDYNNWNYMQPRDLLNPRVFICKAGRFVENVVKKNMAGGDDEPNIVSETYINPEFQQSCDEKDLNDVHLNGGVGGGQYGEDCVTFTDEELDAEIISNSDLVASKRCRPVNQTEVAAASADDSEGSGAGDEIVINAEDRPDDLHPMDLPILVFEGLQRPKPGESEEDVVAQLLTRSTNLTALSVRRAIRLPVLHETSLRSVVLVELDTIEHENEVIRGKSDVIKQSKIDIRKAKYQELWKYIEELSVVTRLSGFTKPQVEPYASFRGNATLPNDIDYNLATESNEDETTTEFG